MVTTSTSVSCGDILNSNGYPNVSLEIPGDIYVGALVRVYTDNGTQCVPKIRDAQSVERVIMYAYAIERLKQRDLVKNVSIGLTLLDNCNIKILAIRHALQMIGVFPDSRQIVPVVGVSGGQGSVMALEEAKALAQRHVPLISLFASSDELGDRSHLPNHFRFNPPTKYHIRALMQMVNTLNWTYISVIYTDDTYGIHGMKEIIRSASSYKICIAFLRMVPSVLTTRQAKIIARNLHENRKARVVMFYGYSSILKSILKALEDRPDFIPSYFIFASGQAGRSAFASHPQAGLGSFGVRVYENNSYGMEFYEHLRQLTYNTLDIPTPWAQQYVEHIFNCSWENASCDEFLNKTFNSSGKFDFDRETIPNTNYVKIYDALATFYISIEKIIENDCPDARNNRSALRECVTGRDVISVMEGLSFEGYTGPIEFDRNGNGIHRITVLQYQQEDSGNNIFNVIGRFEKKRNRIDVNVTALRWPNPSNISDGIQHDKLPKSVCAEPCQYKQYKIQIDEDSCCWQCLTCPVNYKIANDSRSCDKCPETQWPDQMTLRTCKLIKPTYIDHYHTVAICLDILSFLGLMATIGIIIIYWLYRSQRLIKAGSWETSLIILFGFVISLITVFLIFSTPGGTVCYSWRILYHVSYTMIFAPLLTKSNRIYRIFTGGRRGLRSNEFMWTSAKSQIIISVALVFVQLLICTVTVIFLPPTPKRYMPVETRPYVELLCDLPVKALVIPLSYNLV
ncbi:metabotropic glutamate receptor-like [Tubulanus polymorphus]|uniref:metabotropic glutamate receptor-like n=1 Tax=Tubulanus polymorphus TaxID=672921 RepID=UPI003DA39300